MATTDDLRFFRVLLANSINHWKLVFGITATRPHVSYLRGFAFGPHIATGVELSLQPSEEENAFAALEHTATFLCVNQAHAVLEKLDNSAEDEAFSAAFHIARLLRNSFAHDPFAPVWLFGPKLENTILEVPRVIRLDTAGLKGQRVLQAHYGGPLAILRLTQFVDALVVSQQKS